MVPKYLVCVLALGYWWCLVVRRARARVYTFKLRAMAADWTVTEVQSTYCERRSKVEGPKGSKGRSWWKAATLRQSKAQMT